MNYVDFWNLAGPWPLFFCSETMKMFLYYQKQYDDSMKNCPPEGEDVDFRGMTKKRLDFAVKHNKITDHDRNEVIRFGNNQRWRYNEFIEIPE